MFFILSVSLLLSSGFVECGEIEHITLCRRSRSFYNLLFLPYTSNYSTTTTNERCSHTFLPIPPPSTTTTQTKIWNSLRLATQFCYCFVFMLMMGNICNGMNGLIPVTLNIMFIIINTSKNMYLYFIYL